MRLLGWMQHKPRQTNLELFKDLAIGSYCSCLSAHPPLDDDHVSHKKPSLDSIYGSRLLQHPNDECEKTSLETVLKTDATGMDWNYKDETSMVTSELFDGFLAIGTLGSEPVTSEPRTPTFPMSSEKLTERKTEVTEKELKLINDELERFLEAEAEEEGCNESLGRSSYVSTVTLNGMQVDEPNSDDCKAAVYPLQEYLFGASIELPETGSQLKERVSLGEMFRRTKATDETDAGKDGKGDMPAKQEHKPAKQFMKKMLKKFHVSSGSPQPGDEATNSASTKKKINKFLKMFHRKVHPESSMDEKDFTKSHKEKTKAAWHQGNYNAGLMHWDENRKFLSDSKSMKGFQRYNNLKLPQYADTSTNGEYWIKTDADCKFLQILTTKQHRSKSYN
ncbi:hypothetical protein Tsubulata_020764 [Turnera subulata]|uniref:Uncharacterized protein n=1 Tax=Turnera subulata TaxID=218843 RepID=A0A9Q0F0U3_9ROSI|nr:hypothetical protein Tsubulata_020764 [Turnera subulata]